MVKLECKRCGVCCILGPCAFGQEDPEIGSCIYLKFEDGKAVCPLVEDRIEVKEYLGIGKGCLVQSVTNNPFIIEKRNAYLDYKGITDGRE